MNIGIVNSDWNGIGVNNGTGNNNSNEICNSVGIGDSTGIGNSNWNGIGNNNNNNEICNSIGIGDSIGIGNSNCNGIGVYNGIGNNKSNFRLIFTSAITQTKSIYNNSIITLRECFIGTVWEIDHSYRLCWSLISIILAIPNL